MPGVEEFRAKKPTSTVLINGYFGDGKTHAGMTYPRVYCTCFDPSGLDILYRKGNERLLNNLVHYEYIRNANEDELKKVFQENAKAEERYSIYGCIRHAEQMAKEGKIETLFLDGGTYLFDMRWQYINEYEEQKSGNTGNIDTQAMYRNLGLWSQRFVGSDLLTIATRYNLNVVMTCHLKREAKDAVQGSDKTPNRSRKVSLESDISPMIEGGFRSKIEGLFGASIYLDTKLDATGKQTKLAYCDTTFAYGTVVRAKNRYGLPAKLDITGKEFYAELMKNINQVNVTQNKVA